MVWWGDPQKGWEGLKEVVGGFHHLGHDIYLVIEVLEDGERASLAPAVKKVERQSWGAAAWRIRGTEIVGKGHK